MIVIQKISLLLISSQLEYDQPLKPVQAGLAINAMRRLPPYVTSNREICMILSHHVHPSDDPNSRLCSIPL